MRDRRLQELRQRLDQGGSPEVEVAWIAARLRSGDLEQDRLELAAYLGSESARALLPSAPLIEPPKGGVRTFVKRLKHWGRPACLRAAIAATRLLVTERDDRRGSQYVRHLQLSEEYCLDPTPEGLAAMRALPRPYDPGRAKWRAAQICSVIASLGPGYFEWRAKDAVAEVASELGSEPKVRAGIVAELVPWALGYFDPVELRVRARG